MSFIDWLIEKKNELAEKVGFEHYTQQIPDEKDDKDIIIDMKGFGQIRSYTCGPVAVFTVLNYLKRGKIRSSAMLRKINFDEDGCSQTEIIRVLHSYGIKVQKVEDMSFEEVVDAIDKCKPIIASTDSGDHWITIVGVRLKPKSVYYTGNVASLKAATETWARFKANGGCEGTSFVCSLKKK